jgi:hypothetical protein
MKLRKILERRLQSIEDLREASSLCRGLVLSDLDGAGTFLLLFYYFEDLMQRRDGEAVDVGDYELTVSKSIPLIESCLAALEVFDPPAIMASLDSFARSVVRKEIL